MDIDLKGWPALVFIAVCFVWPIYALVSASFATGAVDYCYIEHSTVGSFQEYRLVGHRAWRLDRNIVSFQRFDEAVSAAKEISCPIEKK